MKSYTFRVVIEEDPFEDGTMAYHAYVPALPGCRTWAYTKREVMKNIQEAVQCYLEALMQLGEPIPTESEDEDEEQISSERTC